jgi:hypothetical protein
VGIYLAGQLAWNVYFDHRKPEGKLVMIDWGGDWTTQIFNLKNIFKIFLWQPIRAVK